MNLLGFDVGWSERRRSTGLAWAGADGIGTGRIGSDWELPAEIRAERWDLVAIDAPVVPSGLTESGARSCERALSTGQFQRRCKPGRSEVAGSGRRLREAGGRAGALLERFLQRRPSELAHPRVRPGKDVIEAFPNAFLGVCVPGGSYPGPRTLRRGRKLDWLFDQWIDAGRFGAYPRSLGLPSEFESLARACKNRDERAALICLLTAAAVSTGRYIAVGDAETGYFFLPALAEWEAWARVALDEAKQQIPGLEIR